MQHKICIAPMMGYTHRHFRYLIRLLSQHVGLYTEMVTTGAVLRAASASTVSYPAQMVDVDRNRGLSRYLYHQLSEHPLALQLGGRDPQALAQCAVLGEQWGYDEINLNVGCPSPRVQSGSFGVCLMAEPQRVRECLKAMQDAVSIPVTVKTRLGLTPHVDYKRLCDFVGMLLDVGCKTFIVHARYADLERLTVRQNRSVPPLQYDWVYRLKSDCPAASWVLNGDIRTIDSIRQHLQYVDGVMIGRKAYQDPYFFANMDQLFFADEHAIPSRSAVLEQYQAYMETERSRGTPVSLLIRPILGLIKHVPHAKKIRQLWQAGECDTLPAFLNDSD